MIILGILIVIYVLGIISGIFDIIKEIKIQLKERNKEND